MPEPTGPVPRLEADLAAYYDQEAAARALRGVEPERARRRDGFVAMLRAEGRTRVVDVGLGPGTDAVAMQAAGLVVMGVDLSSEHVALARAADVDARVASVLALPFRDDSFDACWCMSTLMHLPDAELSTALAEIRRVVAPGGPAALGLWGGDDVEGPNPRDTIEPRRFFSWRSEARLRSLLEVYGRVEEFATWQVGEPPDRFTYQWCVLRPG